MAKVLVNIDVDDLDKGVRFYTEGLGLRVGRRFGTGTVELLGAEAPIYLLLKEAGTLPFAGTTRLRDYERHWTPVHLDFVVDDLEAALQRLRRAGATSEGAISERAWGKMALLADPFGHGLCLLQFTGRGYDALTSG
jgi:catechol 2,3-dioxygenase-like lactoylglutathione lyase family enzyme